MDANEKGGLLDAAMGDIALARILITSALGMAARTPRSHDVVDHLLDALRALEAVEPEPARAGAMLR